MTKNLQQSLPLTAIAWSLLLVQCTLSFVHAAGSGYTDASDWTADSTGSDSNDNTATSILGTADNIKIGPGLLAAIAIVTGSIVCVAGYRLFRPTVFTCGFIVGGVFLAGIAEAAFQDESWVATASWVAFFIGGLALGSLVLTFYSASIFLSGAAGGVLLAFTLNTSIGPKIYPANPDVILVILAILLGIAGGFLALKLERPVLIIATSFVGAEVLVWGIGYFAGDYPNGADLKAFRAENSDGDWIYEIPDAWWAYLAGIFVVFFLGMAIQFHKTAKGGVYHRSNAMASSSTGHGNVQGGHAAV